MISLLPAVFHIPVLAEESVEGLQIKPGSLYIDTTLGGGGHSLTILQAGGRVLGIDLDPQALAVARERLQDYSSAVILVRGNFQDLEEICLKHNYSPVQGILFDLGLSTLQLEGGRGFSFQRDEPLDMRIDPGLEVTAADLVNELPQEELADLLRHYGEEPNSRLIARSIVRRRPITTTGQLVEAVEEAVGGRRGRLHPATRVFLALRIVVNRELENLALALKQAVGLLAPGGRLAVISYHSLEDRIVKEFLRQESRDCICPPLTLQCTCGHNATLKVLTRKPITPSQQEREANPRSRSARLRLAERLESPSDKGMGSLSWGRGLQN